MATKNDETFQENPDIITTVNKHIPSTLSKLLTNLSEAALLIRDAEKIVFANPSAEELFGYSAAEFHSISLQSLFGIELDLKDPVFQKNIQSKASSVVVSLIMKNGKQFPAKISMSHFEEDGYHFTGLLIYDLGKLDKKTPEVNLLIENTEEPFIYLDGALIIRAFNKSASSFYHNYFGPHLIEGKSILDYVQPERLEALTALYQSVLKGFRQQSTVSFDSIDGTHKILKVNFNPVKNKEEEVVGIFLSGSDITEESLRIKELEKTKAELDKIKMGSLDLICTISDDDIFIDVSAISFYILGYRPEELIGKKTLDLVHPEDLEKTRELLRDPNLHHIGISDFKNRFIHKNGSVVYLEWTAVWHREIKLRYGIARDITEKVQAEEKLQQSERRFKSLVQEGSDMIGILDAAGKYLYVSPTSEQIVGFQTNELIGRSAFEFMHNDDLDMVKKKFEELHKFKKIVVEPFRFQHHDGSWRWIETTLTNLLDEPSVIGIVANSRDVTERVSWEEKMLYQKQEKEALINATEDLIWSVNCDCNLVAANRAFIRAIEKHIGQTIKVEEGISLNELPNNFISQWKENCRRATNGESFRVESVSRIGDNKLSWSETAFNPIYANYEIIGIACCLRDITARKNAEQIIIESEARYIEAQTLAKAGSWQTDLHTNEVIWSPETFRIFELDHESFELSHKAFLNFVHYDDLQNVKNAFEGSLASTLPAHCIEHRIISAKGNEKIVEERWKIIKDDQGNPLKAVGSCQDITQRKTAEQSNNFKAQLLNTIGQAAIATDLNGTVTFWNQAAEKIYGWTIDEAMGKNIIDLTPAEQTVQQAAMIMDTVAGGNSWSGEFMVKRKNGETFPALVNNSPVYDEQGVLSGIVGVSTDITEQIKTAQFLEENNLRYKYVTKATFDAIWDWDIESQEFYWGENYEEIFGRIDEPGLNEIEKARKRLHPEEIDKIRASVLEAIKSDLKNWNYEHRYLKSDGTYAHVSNRAIVIRNEAGKAVRAIGAMQDISERKSKVEQLKLLESVIVHANDAVLITEAEPINEPGPRILYVNEAFTRMTGYKPEEVIGKSPRLLQGPKSNRSELDRMRKSMEKWQPCEITTINYKKNGEEFWINFSITPVANETGWFTHWISIERDVTAQKLTEENLRSMNERYNLAAMATSDIIWDWNLITNKVVRSDDAMKKLFGYSDGEEINTATFWADKEHPEDRTRIENLFKVAFADPSVTFLEQEYRFLRKDGTYAFIKDKGFILRDDAGRAVRMIGAAQDITKLKESELKLQQINAELEKRARELVFSNKELEQFAYVASHDLQEPLRMVSSFLTQIERKYNDLLDDKGKKYIHFAVDGAKRMRQIILDLLEYSRAGQIYDEWTEVDLDDVIKEIKILFRKQVHEKNAVITHSRLPVIYAARSPMRQLFQNLIGNALLYSREGFAPEIRIECLDKGNYWEFSISDNGIGIHQEYFEKIFIIFQRLHSKANFAGTGMGLSLAKKIVTQFGGKIWLKSEEDTGSTFYFTIPKKIPPRHSTDTLGDE